MNQKLSWTLLVAGGALFLYQLGDLLAAHSTWSEVWSPAGTGEILRTLGGAFLAVMGALGIKVGNGGGGNGSGGTGSGGSTLGKIASVALIVSLGLSSVGLAGCALGSKPGGAIVSVSPTEAQIQKTRETAIRISDATTAALKMAEAAVKGADALERAGQITPATLRSLANGLIVFSDSATKGLDVLGSTTSNPSLLSTTVTILANLDPLLNAMEQSGNDQLRQAANFIRIGTSIARVFVSNGGN